MFRGAVAVCALLVTSGAARAGAQADVTQPDDLSALARARAEDARADHGAAIVHYEEHAARCLGASTAMLDPGEPCSDTAAALTRAFELARAAGDLASADRIATSFARHLLYAHPREATRMGYELACLHLDAGRARDAALVIERWTSLDRADPPAGHAILVDALRGRIALAMGRPQQAAALFRRMERRFTAEQSELAEDGALPSALVRETVAEARLLRAQPHVERFLASGLPRAGAVRDPDEQWTRVIGPWRLRVERRLLLARMELERVYELGSPRHSVVVAARIGEMYAHLAELHTAAPLPENEWYRVLMRRGVELPGYDEARTHLETCVRWSQHHGVAQPWAERCERELHAIDPERYPLASELSGRSAYLPASFALPSPPSEAPSP